MCSRSMQLWITVSFVTCLIATSLNADAASSTEFIYQGQLKQNAIPVNATVDLEFTLWDTDIAGNQIGSPVSKNATPVINGLFQVSLDFGPNALDGQRWLAISVRNPAGSGSFEDVLPRQRISSSPYSIQTRGIFVDENDSVGLGTTSPKARLHNAGDYYGRGHVLLHAFEGDGANGAAYLQARDDSGASSIDLRLRTQEAGAIRDSLSLSANGNVGIGTITPATKLDVHGGAINIGNTGDQATLLGFATERSWAFKQQASGSNTALKLQSIGGGGAKNFLIETGGSVGIGTLAPDAKLHVVGGSDASQGLPGYIQCGESDDRHIIIDDRNIISRGGQGRPARLTLDGNPIWFTGQAVFNNGIEVPYTIVRTPTTDPSNTPTVNCPAGYKILGGGCDGVTARIIRSAPIPANHGWACEFEGSSVGSAHAICAKIAF